MQECMKERKYDMPIIGQWAKIKRDPRNIITSACHRHVGNCGAMYCPGQLVCGCKPRREHNWQCHTRKPAFWKRYLWTLVRD